MDKPPPAFANPLFLQAPDPPDHSPFSVIVIQNPISKLAMSKNKKQGGEEILLYLLIEFHSKTSG